MRTPTPYRVTAQFWDHSTLWSDDESMAGHTTDGGRVFGVTRTRYVECDRYGCQPVAVIDPGDTEAVERLYLDFLGRLRGRGITVGLMDAQYNRDIFADALREFADPKPPKPDEPSAIGTRVAIAWNGGIKEMAVRFRLGDGSGRGVDWCTESGCHVSWESLPAVEVLSEGVTP